MPGPDGKPPACPGPRAGLLRRGCAAMTDGRHTTERPSRTTCKSCNKSFRAVHRIGFRRIIGSMKVLHAAVGAVALLAVVFASGSRHLPEAAVAAAMAAATAASAWAWWSAPRSGDPAGAGEAVGAPVGVGVRVGVRLGVPVGVRAGGPVGDRAGDPARSSSECLKHLCSSSVATLRPPRRNSNPSRNNSNRSRATTGTTARHRGRTTRTSGNVPAAGRRFRPNRRPEHAVPLPAVRPRYRGAARRVRDGAVGPRHPRSSRQHQELRSFSRR